MDKFVVWFVGDEAECPGLCYHGRDVFCASSKDDAKQEAKILAENAQVPQELFKVCKIVDVE